ncbi:hypothetical protein [Paenibacillus sp. 1P07SE]|uniref:hypothetical protein n=1 Tax=Paenibacillus sp. 1P07SE TaxID=3132209 RepID=UPI0039A6FA80
MKEKNNHPDSLVTQREIDPSFGLFEEEEEAQYVPDAESELTELYPEEDVIPDDLPPNESSAQDEAAPGTPVDPAAPEEITPGIDLINGVGTEPEKETT